MHPGPRARIFVFTILAALGAGVAHTAAPVPPQGKIANGLLTQAYPSVGLFLNGSTVCSGTLIGCSTFLTAAHCVCEDPVTGLILNGRQCNARPDLLDPANKQAFFQHAGRFAVKSVTVHPRFQFRLRGDLAVLTLAQPVTGVGTSRLDLVSKPALGTAGTVVGFGLAPSLADKDGTLSGIKRVGAVTTASCVGVNDLTHVCFTFDNPLGPPGSNSDTCRGDSGGPLFVDFGDGDVVAGVTSGGDSATCHPVDHSFDADVFLDRAFLQQAAGVDLDRGFCGDVAPLGSPGTAVLGGAGTLSATVPRQVFPFDVPAGTERLRLALNAESGVRLTFAALPGDRPIPGLADCSGETVGGLAFCEVLAPAPGRWTVVVRQVAGAGAFQLTATLLPHLLVPGPCFSSPTALCLADGRFRVEAAWQTFDGSLGLAQALPLSDPAGFFSFFDPAPAGDIEIAVKVLDACSLSGHFWVFAAGLTDVKTLLTVTDTATGKVRTYLSPQGTPFPPVQDAAAFASCP